MDFTSIISSLGWTLINSLWQAIFILTILIICLLLINKKYSNVRSILAYLSLILIFVISTRTFVEIHFYNQNKINTSQIIALDNNYSLALLNNFENNESMNANTSIKAWDKIFNFISSYGSSNMNYIVAIWLTGLLILSIRMFGGYYYMQKLKNKNIIPVDDKWIDLLMSISHKIQLSKSVQLFESTVIKFPTVIGYFKPVILMPLGTLSGMPQNQIEMILAHELAHIKRSDYLLNLIQSFLEIIYFFNPAIWIISKIIRNEREFACDDLAITINPDKIILANALVTLYQKNSINPKLAVSAIGTKNSLLGRIKKMTQSNNKSDFNKRVALAGTLLLALFAITFISCSTTNENLGSSKLSTASSANFEERPSDNEIDDLVQEVESLNEIKEDNTQKLHSSFSSDKNGERKFNFHKDDTHWKGIVKNGKVTSLEIDGEKISNSEIPEHENFIIDTLDEIDTELADLDIDLKDLRIDMQHLNDNLNDLKIDVDLDDLDQISEYLDSKDFHNEIENLKESMKDLKIEIDDEWKHELKDILKNNSDWDINIKNFDSEEFKEEMNKLKNELKTIKDIDLDFDFDKEALRESMKELKENMKNLKLNLDDIDIDLSDLKIDMKELKVEMKKLKKFMKEFKADLVNENIISSTDEEFELKFSRDEIIVDGEVLPNHLHERYLEMYEEHFGKTLEGDFVIHN